MTVTAQEVMPSSLELPREKILERLSEVAKTLTPINMAFAEAYLRTWDCKRAAREAGSQACDDHGHHVQGNEWLRQPEIREYISLRVAIMQMAADEVLFRLALQARASVEDFYDIDENGQPMLNLKKARDFGLLPLVKKLKLDARGNWEVELHDSQQALVQLGKFHSLWTDKITVEDDDVNKSVPELEQRVDRITLLLNAARDRRDRQSDSGK
jgi:hypothetical protein